MANLKHCDDAEREIRQALANDLRKEGRIHPSGKCPSVRDLRRFAAGKYGKTVAQREELIEHLADCDRCNDWLTRIREEGSSKRAAFDRPVKSVLAIACVVTLALALWTWWRVSQTSPETNRVAVADLRLVSPTRGSESIDRSQAIRVPRRADRLRIVLPPGSEGNYELEILRSDADATPLIRLSGATRLENHEVILGLSANLSNLKPGRYSLGLRRDGSEWEYYPLALE
jgi:hypothetical protein